MPNQDGQSAPLATQADDESQIATPTPEAPAAVPARFDQLDAERQQKALALVQEIDPKDSTSLISFGASAQQNATQVAENILQQAKQKDLGSVGTLLNDVVKTARGLDVSKVKDGEKPGFFARLFGKLDPVVDLIQSYEGAASQIETLVEKLEDHRIQLYTDIAHLDQQYQACLTDFERVELYIAAGEKKLHDIDTAEIPALKRAVEAAQDDPLKVEELNQLAHVRDELERRVHDLKLTREILSQTLPDLRNHQNNDKSLAGKIRSIKVNTVPLWKQKMAQALLLHNTRQAAQMVEATNDFTNDLIRETASQSRAANKETRKAVERGMIDIETVEFANSELIGMIEDTLQITAESRARREDAEKRLQAGEAKRHSALKAAAEKTRAELPAGNDAA